MIKSTITKREYQAIYRLLNRVSPLDQDCGLRCGAVCCTSEYTGDEAPETAFLNNRENTVRMLDEYIAELSERRDLLDQGDRAGLRDRLESGRKIREQWLGDQRQKNKDKTVPSWMPAPAEMMAHTFFGGLLRKKDRN